MPKEENKKSGGGDGLDQAADQVTKIEDSKLAELFIEANRRARTSDTPEICELYVEEKKEYEFQEHVPDPELLTSIRDSLTSTEIHHKKLLEEGAPTNALLSLLQRIKELLLAEKKVQKRTVIVPEAWRFFSICHKNYKKRIYAYLNDFSSMTELWLRNAQKSTLMFKFELILLAVISVISIPLIIFWAKPSSHADEFRKAFASTWSNLIFYSASFSFVFALIPPFFLMTLWFVNVNHLHNSKNFHFFLFAFFTVAVIFLALAIFNTLLFYVIHWKWGIIS